MIMKKLKATTAIVAIALSGTMALSDGYGPFPVTLKGYSGDCTNTVSYSGQIARHVQHDSLKHLSTKGDYSEMNSYYSGSDKNKQIWAPASKDGFPIKQTLLNLGSRDDEINHIIEKAELAEKSSNQILEFTKKAIFQSLKTYGVMATGSA